MADAASRGRHEVLRHLAQQVGMTLEQVSPPQELPHLLARLVRLQDHVDPAFHTVGATEQNDQWLRKRDRASPDHIKSFLRDTFDANHVPSYSGVGMRVYDTVRKSILTVGGGVKSAPRACSVHKVTGSVF